MREAADNFRVVILAALLGFCAVLAQAVGGRHG
jgi:hypothetical protein